MNIHDTYETCIYRFFYFIWATSGPHMGHTFSIAHMKPTWYPHAQMGPGWGPQCKWHMGPRYPIWCPYLTIWAAHVGKELYVPTSIPDGPQMVYLGSIWALCYTAHM